MLVLLKLLFSMFDHLAVPDAAVIVPDGPGRCPGRSPHVQETHRSSLKELSRSGAMPDRSLIFCNGSSVR